MTAPGPTVAATIEGRRAAGPPGRRADTGRRRQRVLVALADAAESGSEVSVTAIARRAGVDRTFLYRHRDLLGQAHAQAAEPATFPGGRGPAVSRASLQADLELLEEWWGVTSRAECGPSGRRGSALCGPRCGYDIHRLMNYCSREGQRVQWNRPRAA
ncbi:hypothetical protein [Streptomyces sp. NPDC002671]